MNNEDFVLGIDLGKEGVHIAVLNKSNEMVYSSSKQYLKGLEQHTDLLICFKGLLKNIPNSI